MHTAIQCLVLAARQHGVDLSVGRVVHDYAIGEEEPSEALLLRIAMDNGLRARSARLSWKRLPRLAEAFPVIAQLENQNSVLLVGFHTSEEDGQQYAQVIDPLANRPEVIQVDRERFESVWKGQIIFVKAAAEDTSAAAPFGFKTFLGEIARQKVVFTEIAVVALVLHGVALAVPIYFQIVFNRVIGYQSYDTLYVLAVGVLIALGFNAILGYLRGLLLLHATSRIDVRLATRTFGKLMSLPISYFQTQSAGTLTKHMTQAEAVRQFLTGRVFLTLLDATALVVFIPILFIYSATLTWVVLGFTALIGLVMLLVASPYRRRLEALYNAEGKRQSMLVESIGGIETVKALAIEPNARRQWDRLAANAVRLNFEVGKIGNLAREASGFFEKTMTVAVIFVGAQLVFNEGLSIGSLIAFYLLAGRVSGPLVQLVTLVQDFQQNRLSVRMLGQVMNQRSERDGGRGLTRPLTGAVEFDRVTFRYAEGPAALDRLSFRIQPGQVIGIVGRSGSGKSTITRLIQGLFVPQQGVVRVGGFDIRELDLAHLRASIGVVPQQSFLFKGSIRENIAKTKPDATFEEIVAAARLAGAYEFIERLPQGFDTQIEEGATNLSGGQRQRLAIARALLRQPAILIFDEATSALDPESESIIQDNLGAISAGRTVINVSHRLASLVDADLILVMDHGRLVSAGRHAQLLERSAVYAALWERQNRHLLAGQAPAALSAPRQLTAGD